MRAFLMSVLLALPAYAASADAAADADALRRVEQAFDALTSMRAEFRQSVTDARGELIESAEGTVSLARPGRFRWDYRVPEQVIVSDGVTVWFHDVELEQVTIRQAADTVEGTPAMLLTGEGDLRSEFDVSDGGKSEGLVWSRLMPRRADGDFRELRLGFADGQLRRMTLLDRLGQTTEIEFARIERNPRLDASTFRFTPPPGVDVVGRAPAGST
jgi:outer membrane lipoprotein carrier protein